MSFSYAEVIRVLCRVYEISEEGVPTFKARLRKLQTAGIPQGANPGKGKRVSYDYLMVIELAVAVEFTQAGVPPLMIVDLITANAAKIRDASLYAMLVEEKADLLLAFSPEALRELTHRKNEGIADAIRIVDRVEFAAFVGRPREPFQPASGNRWRWFFIILRELIEALLDAFTEEMDIDMEEFVSEIFSAARARYPSPAMIETAVEFGMEKFDGNP